MSEPRVTGLRSAEFAVPDVGAARRFYEECWGLETVAEDGGAAYLRGTGPEHHLLALRPGPERKLLGIHLAAGDRAAVDGLHARAESLGTAPGRPAELRRPGGGYGFVFRDLHGREYTISAGVSRHAAEPAAAARPVKLSHVVQNSPDRKAQSAQFVDVLGFKLSDRTDYMDFIRCSSDHHALAYTEIATPTLNHCAFELPSHDALMHASGRMKRAGYPVEWGVGRHGPGNNVFAYFIDPCGYVIEYTAEVEQVDDGYRTGMPEDWVRPPEYHNDRWGFAGPPSARFREAAGG